MNAPGGEDTWFLDKEFEAASLAIKLVITLQYVYSLIPIYLVLR